MFHKRGGLKNRHAFLVRWTYGQSEIISSQKLILTANNSITAIPNLNVESFFLKKKQGWAAEGEERAKLPSPVVSLYKPYTCIAKKGSPLKNKNF
jgi:hypothetical protein